MKLERKHLFILGVFFLLLGVYSFVINNKLLAIFELGIATLYLGYLFFSLGGAK